MFTSFGHIHIFTYSDIGYVGKQGDRRTIVGNLTFVRGNLVPKWNKK